MPARLNLILHIHPCPADRVQPGPQIADSVIDRRADNGQPVALQQQLVNGLTLPVKLVMVLSDYLFRFPVVLVKAG